MVRHYWGDKDVDWKGIDGAAALIGKICTRYGRMMCHTKEKYGCYDNETEVLTKDGWKLFKDTYIETDLFATLAEKDKLEYQKATRYFEDFYSGDMYSLNTRGVNLLVTPNHNLYCAKGETNGGKNNIYLRRFPYQLQTYENLFRKRKIFLKGAVWIGELPEFISVEEYKNEWNNVTNSRRTYVAAEKKYKTEDFVKLLGWYVAEGCDCKHESVLNLNNTDSGKEVKKVQDILDRLKIPYTVRLKPTSAKIAIQGVQFSKYFSRECGHLAENKKVPKFIKTLSPYLIKCFLEALYEGDGHKAKTSHILTTVSKRLADDVLELLLKAGYCGRISTRKRALSIFNGRTIKSNLPAYEINWLKKTEHHSINCHDSKETVKKKEKMIKYSGMVYCVSVPNKILYVRRNGKPVWCGNTVRAYATFGYLCLHGLIYPAYVSNQFPKWLWNLDCEYIAPFLQRFFTRPFVWWQTKVYRYAYKTALRKYPHLREEILCCADYHELLKDL